MHNERILALISSIALILNPKYFLSMRKFSMRVIIKSNENFLDDDYSNNITTLYVRIFDCRGGGFQ